MFLFFNLTFLTMFIPGVEGMNRRVAIYPESFNDINFVVTIFAFLMGVSMIPFVYNMANSWIRGAVAGDNPWQASTLEWQTTSPPPEENFEHEPEVFEGPYNYGRKRARATAPSSATPAPAEGD
jgi:cytochrome c oxidase subunit 1